MTSPDDQLDGIFSRIAAQDQVDPAVFEQTLEAAFDYTGPGLDELIPDSDATFEDDADSTSDDLYVDDLTDDSSVDDDSDADTDADDYDTPVSPDDDYTPGDDLDL